MVCSLPRGLGLVAPLGSSVTLTLWNGHHCPPVARLGRTDLEQQLCPDAPCMGETGPMLASPIHTLNPCPRCRSGGQQVRRVQHPWAPPTPLGEARVLLTALVAPAWSHRGARLLEALVKRQGRRGCRQGGWVQGPFLPCMCRSQGHVGWESSSKQKAGTPVSLPSSAHQSLFPHLCPLAVHRWL